VSELKWTRWQPQRAKAAIAGRVAQNMEVACLFVVDKARGLVPVRTGITRRDIDFVVEVGARGNVVEGIVGVKRGKAFYAKFVEWGTRKMAAMPFLRPAVFNNKREIRSILQGR